MRFTRLVGFFVPLASLACSPPVSNTSDAASDVARVDTAVDGTTDHDATPDAPVIDTPSVTCANDNDCTDGTYCNGAERCMPGTTGADARGCVAASPANPCATGQTCNETMQRCLSPCDTAADTDGDGHRAMNCGGDDCDDADANRFPGHPEVCDSSGHDEDCDAATFGVRDDDHDGSPDARCCNTDSGGTMNCGRDCDDSSASVNPSAPEVCNGIDDNCVGGADEGVMNTFYRDADNDMYGDPASSPMMGCARPAGYVDDNTDCDDTNASRHPGAPEVCDGIDNNCAAGIDEGLTVMMCYPDADADGYGTSTGGMMTCGACPSGYTNNTSAFDCVDTDARVHPGQMAFDSMPAIVSGMATYDFNCNGVGEMQYTNTSTATDATACGRGITSCGPTWVGTSTPPACGALGSLIICATSTSGGIASCTARSTPTPTRQACR